MTLLIIVDGWNPEPWRARFQALLPDREIAVWSDAALDPQTVTYVACWKPPVGLLRTFPNLQAMFSLGAGVDHMLRDPDLPHVPLVRVIDPDLTARMSEWVVMNALMHLRRVPLYLEQQRARHWHERADQPAASDVRVGVMGLGVMGLDAATKLQALGFQVVGWARTPKALEGVETYAGAAEMAAFLARTDILACVLPLTHETRGILNRDLFRQLGRNPRMGGPVLMNAGRGGLQVEADILGCLEDGTLAAASLDVFETEPLPTDSPLWTHPRVVVTPHNAAVSDPDAVSRFIVAQITAFEAGEPMAGQVNPRAGY